MNDTKEIDREISDLEGKITKEYLELYLGLNSTAKVGNSSCSRKRTLQLEPGDAYGRGRNITGEIRSTLNILNDPIFTYENKFGKETEADLPNSGQISTELNLYTKSSSVRCKKDKEFDTIKKFSVYAPAEEEIERVSRVSTKLKLYEDPWKIKKVIWQTECDTFHWLMLEKEEVERFLLPFIKIDQTILENNGKEFKVWDSDTKTEHVLKLEKWIVHYAFTNWETEFVKRRRLKSRDETGMF